MFNGRERMSQWPKGATSTQHPESVRVGHNAFPDFIINIFSDFFLFVHSSDCAYLALDAGPQGDLHLRVWICICRLDTTTAIDARSTGTESKERRLKNDCASIITYSELLSSNHAYLPGQQPQGTAAQGHTAPVARLGSGSGHETSSD